MHRLVVASALVLVAFALSSCYNVGGVIGGTGGLVMGSGKSATRDFNLTDFTQLDVGNAFQVEVTQADTFGVTITADDNLFDYIRVTREGNTLRISLDPTHRYSLGLNAMQAKIKMPTLEGVVFSGATRGTIAGFKSTRDLSVNLSGASGLTGGIDAGNVSLEASGASSVTLTGSGKDARLNASGASRFNLGDFALDTADVTLSGASSGAVNAKSKLGYDLSGASNLTYSGTPVIGKSQTSGASRATRK